MLHTTALRHKYSVGTGHEGSNGMHMSPVFHLCSVLLSGRLSILQERIKQIPKPTSRLFASFGELFPTNIGNDSECTF